MSSKASNDEENSSREIMQSSYEQAQKQLTVGAKVAQAGKDVSYFAVILVGFAITGALIWYIVSELVFSFSPNKVYSDALKKVKLNSEVIDAVGEPMKAYGEETSRGRRRHVSYQEYIVNGENYMRVKFYISGPKQKGTVHADVKQGSRGNFEFRFIFVEFKGFPGTVIVLDNR